MPSKGTTDEQVLRENVDENIRQKELKNEKKEKLYKDLKLDKKSAFGVARGNMTFKS